MIHCRTCGRGNRSGAAFYDACGSRLSAPVGAGWVSVSPMGVSDGGTVSPLPASPYPRSIEPFAEGVFVGRQREMEALRSALEEALSGQGRLMMLVAEPGIGKTRMAQELSTYAERRGARVLWGRCYENPGAPPYWPWVQIIRTYVREHVAEQLRIEMGAGAADITDLVPEVRERLVDLGPPFP
jgi:hypothetical protein